MRIGKIILRIMGTIVVVCVVLQTALILTAAIFNYKCFAVGSDSMSPYLRTGDLVITKPAAFDEIRMNDVVTFGNLQSDSYFTHRVVGINKEKQWLYTKGDANSVEDPTPTSYDYVIGKVVVSFKFLGYIHMVLNSVYSVVMIAAFIIMITLYKICVSRKRTKNEQA